MTAKLIQCAACMMWEVRDTDDVSGSYSCGKCVHIQLLKEVVATLKKELEDLRLIRENENFLDRTFSKVTIPRIPEERRGISMTKEDVNEVQETPGEAPIVNRLTVLETAKTDNTASPRGGQVCKSKIVVEAEPRSQTSRRGVVIGDSTVRGTDRGFCGNRRDLRMVCCLPGARIQDVTDRVQRILEGEGEDPEVLVHVGTNDFGKKRRSILQRDFRELGRRLKSRTSRVVISGFLPVPRVGEGRNREIMDLNVWLRDWCRKQGFKFLDHWGMFWGEVSL
ncbi:uncharacterized protein LOC132209920 isoform X2 [Stegostoma tigrinum]|uniref:uncharacterized protein LOC132209920 isoform X2 n=1 Tax=Stegostoma tigrinum TaxID=3053191 RepID=UPI0028703F7D|nr:uncharacterized protein LOC132209920 isoform X2 [Stegostoma tigrinum]